MAISSNATGLRPGVVTSTTRPTNPYTGQIIYETNTGYLRVWDGSAWDYLSQAADTNAYLNNGGYVYVGGGSFTTSANTDFDNVFSSTFDQYRALINVTAVSSNNVLYLRFINTAGNVDTTLNYDWQLLEYYQTTVVASQSMADNGCRIGYAYATPGFAAITIDFFNPNVATRTNVMVQETSPSGTTFVLGDDTKGHFRQTTQFRGFRLLATGGATVTGTCQIMGVRKA